GEGPHRKGPSPVRVFGYFLHEQKVTRVWAGEAQEIVSRIAAIRGKKCCLPSRPAIRESALYRPDALAQRHQKRERAGAKPPKTRRRRGCCLSFSISHFPAWVSQYRQR